MENTRHLTLRLVGLFAVLLMLYSGNCVAGQLYLNLIWHQHQPLYLDPQSDQLRGPWVRTHATKDYYDMAAMHEDYPEIHATINLTSSLLVQLQTYYIDRLSPFLLHQPNGKWAVDSDSYFAKWGGKTDPWIDLALKPSAQFDSTDRAQLIADSWNAFGISSVQIGHFPDYAALRDKAASGNKLTTEDLTAIKAWFFLAHFDPDFLRGKAKLDVNLSDLVSERDGKFYLAKMLTENDANRLVADAVRVMQAIIPEHRTLMYDPATHTGQLEIITTPFYHPILPLLIDSDVARICQPKDSLPSRFSFPQDARAQVLKSRDYYLNTFGIPPMGMWPAEGSISIGAADMFAENGINWICGDMQVLERSTPKDLPLYQPYRVAVPSGKDISVVFRETHLSDHIGFTYQKMNPDSASSHFIREILKYKPGKDEPDRLLTVILDGENAWEWYEQDMDGKQFLHTLYQKLTNARKDGSITCVTPTEYFDGNPLRSVSAHPVASQARIEKLWPGSWINANYDTWIGEPEENNAWEYLLQTRHDLERSGLEQPDPQKNGLPEMYYKDRNGDKDRKWDATLKAFESMYAAEGSDWFWWYGADQSAPGGDLPFEKAFFSHLRAVYQHMREAGIDIKTPDFKPILTPAKLQVQSGGGVMSQGAQSAKVRFECNATKQKVTKAIYIVGNLPEIGEWSPNIIVLYDDGSHGDVKSGDGIWTLELQLPVGAEVQYKYTNSGDPGVWQPSEEFSFANRVFTVDTVAGGFILRADVFGVRE